jgi:hypothetical protein
MRKLLFIFLVISVVLAFAGVAMAGGPPGEGDNPPNQGKPTNPPCDSDHGHPLENLLNQGKDCPPGQNPCPPQSNAPQCQEPEGAVNECPDTFAAGPLRLHLEAAGDPGHSGGSLVHACLTLGNPPPAPVAPCPPEGEIVAVQTDQASFITVCVLI